MKSGAFSENLYKYRMLKKITQREVADRIGVRQQTVAAWEAGRSTPSPDILCGLAQIFEITTDELLKRGEEMAQDWPMQRLQVPVLQERVLAEGALLLPENIAAYRQLLGRPDAKCFLFRCTDDSMSPVVCKNDLVLLESCTEAAQTGIYLFRGEEGALLLRKAEALPEGILLLPYNPAEAAGIFLPASVAPAAWQAVGYAKEVLRDLDEMQE